MLRQLLRDTHGASAAEYALILSVVGVVIAVSALALGNNISESMDTTSEEIESCGGQC